MPFAPSGGEQRGQFVDFVLNLVHIDCQLVVFGLRLVTLR